MATRLNKIGNTRTRDLVSLSKIGSRRAGSPGMDDTTNGTEVLEFERAYPPTVLGGLWRLRWEEHHRRRDTTAKGRAEAVPKAAEIVERVASGTDLEHAKARGAHLVAHYLDPRRRPARVAEWSDRMREEKEWYCEKYVTPP
jgi:hypothetical protein